MSRSVMRVAPHATAASPTPGKMYALFPCREMSKGGAGKAARHEELTLRVKSSLQTLDAAMWLLCFVFSLYLNQKPDFDQKKWQHNPMTNPSAYQVGMYRVPGNK